jgi:hypothetical protein
MVSMTADTYRLLLSPVTVTLHRKVIDGQPRASSEAVAYAQQNAQDQSDVGYLGGRTTVFHLWRAHLVGSPPKQGDAITDSHGITWTVREVTACGRDSTAPQRWRCVGVKEV